MDAQVKHADGDAAPAMDIESLSENARAATAVLKALSHESRLLLLCMLVERERSVGELENLLQMRQSAVSQQLARLRFDGLVKTRRDGKTVYYSIADANVRRIIDVLHEIYCRRPPAG